MSLIGSVGLEEYARINAPHTSRFARGLIEHFLLPFSPLTSSSAWIEASSLHSRPSEDPSPNQLLPSHFGSVPLGGDPFLGSPPASPAGSHIQSSDPLAQRLLALMDEDGVLSVEAAVRGLGQDGAPEVSSTDVKAALEKLWQSGQVYMSTAPGQFKRTLPSSIKQP